MSNDSKSSIMDSLKKTKFYQEIKERIHLTQFEAVSSINPDLAKQTHNAETILDS